MTVRKVEIKSDTLITERVYSFLPGLQKKCKR